VTAVAEWLTWQVADSAFPAGAFVHSWGLEAAWQQGEVPDAAALSRFLRAAIQQAGFGVLPLLNGAYTCPESLEVLDALADAFLVNAVSNRASRSQGRSLVATVGRVWPSPETRELERRAAATRAHLGPVAGSAFRAVGLSLRESQRVMLYGTARGVLAAAVRLGIAGTYEAQRLQHASAPWLETVANRCAASTPDDLAQTSPISDLLQGSHDRLYSRLFQS
jgi:urease accessory protein